MAINTSNLKKLRKSAKLTQEQVAERLNVSRQTVAKWETGESLPDIDNCIALAQLYKVSLDDLVMYAKNPSSSTAPAGKHMFGVVKVDEKGRIVIPEKAREIFRINSGDKLLMMGDENNGIAIVKLNSFLAATAEIMNIIRETDPDESEEG
ncbi:MAG: helix-turn-helix domain-containing protein [Ruminiclostridium sp.]